MIQFFRTLNAVFVDINLEIYYKFELDDANLLIECFARKIKGLYLGDHIDSSDFFSRYGQLLVNLHNIEMEVIKEQVCHLFYFLIFFLKDVSFLKEWLNQGIQDGKLKIVHIICFNYDPILSGFLEELMEVKFFKRILLE